MEDKIKFKISKSQLSDLESILTYCRRNHPSSTLRSKASFFLYEIIKETHPQLKIFGGDL